MFLFSCNCIDIFHSFPSLMDNWGQNRKAELSPVLLGTAQAGEQSPVWWWLGWIDWNSGRKGEQPTPSISFVISGTIGLTLSRKPQAPSRKKKEWSRCHLHVHLVKSFHWGWKQNSSCKKQMPSNDVKCSKDLESLEIAEEHQNSAIRYTLRKI